MGKTRGKKEVTLFKQGMRAMKFRQGPVATALRVSVRNVARYAAGAARPHPEHYAWLARAVHPRDPVLASKIASAGGHSLESLGLGAVPVRFVVSSARVVDIVVCAAATALSASPEAVRPALKAAFDRAKELGLSIDLVAAELGK